MKILGEALEAVMCSAAPPLYFPPQNFAGTTWADGGCIINLDVFSAVRRCYDVVGDESKIIVDMIFCSGADISPLGDVSDLTPLDVVHRLSQVTSYDSAMWFVYNAMAAYPKVNFRYTIVPSAAMPGGAVPLDFNRTNLENELALGEADAYTLITSSQDSRAHAHKWRSTRHSKVRAFKRS